MNQDHVPQAPHFEIFQSAKTRNFYWRLVGANGEPMAASEAYPTKHHAQRAIERLVDLFKPQGKQTLSARNVTEVSE